MSEFRRKLTIINISSVKPASSYIQHDIIFQLDGLEKGNNAGKWTDLINGYVFQGNATELKNGWDFNGAHKLECNGVYGISQLNSNKTWTIEIAMHYKNPSKWGMIFTTDWNYSSRSRHFMLAYGATDLLCAGCSQLHDGRRLYSYKINRNSDITWSTFCNKSTSVLNGSLISYNDNKTSSLGSSDAFMMIGNREPYNGGDAYMTIYAIRVYNRELTTAEMQYNQRLDIERFNLNIS